MVAPVFRSLSAVFCLLYSVFFLCLLPFGAFAFEGLSLFPSAPPLRIETAQNSGIVSLTALCVSLALGIPAGLVIVRSALLRALTIIPLLLPPCLYATTTLAWPAAPSLLAGLCLALNLWPIVALFTSEGIRHLDRSQIESALLHLPRPRIFRKIVWPSLRPWIASAAAIVLALSLSEASVPMVFALPTFSSEVYTQFASFYNAGGAFKNTLPPLCFAIPALLAITFLRHVRQSSSSRIPPIRTYLCVMPLIAFGLSLSVPSIGFLQSAPLKTLQLHWEDLLWGFSIAAISAVLSTAWAWLGSALTPFKPRWLSLFEPLLLINLFVPSATLGIGILSLANRMTLPDFVHSSGSLLVLTAFSRSVGLAWLLMRTQIPRNQIEAATLSGMRPTRILLRISGPPLWKPALSSFLLVSLVTFADPALPLLLAPPGHSTPSTLIVTLIHYGYDESVGGLGVLCLTVALIGGTLLFWQSNSKR